MTTIAAYTADPWDSVLPVIRYRHPAEAAGLTVLSGNQGPEVDVSRVSQADIVLIQRDFPRFARQYAQVVQAARQQARPVVYEIDDLLFELPAGHPAHPDLSVFLFPMLWAVQEADLVTVSTPYLQDYLAPLHPHVLVLPNYLDDRLWVLQPPRSPAPEGERPVVIGYMGGATHSEDIAMVAPVLERLLDQAPDRIRLRFWGARPPGRLADHPAVEWIPLDLQDYADFVRTFSAQSADIFVAPLQENPFNQAKSAIKFLEYSALGVPGVYSRVGPYPDVLLDGQTGFLAASPEEWEDRLNRLIADPRLRFKLGRAAQDAVRRDWLLSDHAGAWATAYEQAALALPPDAHDQQRFTVITRAAERALERFVELDRNAVELAQERDRLANDLTYWRGQAEAHQQHAALLQAQLDEIYASQSWQLIQKAQGMRRRLVPPGSRREGWLQRLSILSQPEKQP